MTKVIINGAKGRMGETLLRCGEANPDIEIVAGVDVGDDLPGVIEACSERGETWISHEIQEVYTELHRMGFVHSVETSLKGELVGLVKILVCRPCVGTTDGGTTSSVFPSHRRSCTTRGQDLPVSAVVGTGDSYLILAGEPEPLSRCLAVARIKNQVSCVDRTGERGLRHRPDTSGNQP